MHHSPTPLRYFVLLFGLLPLCVGAQTDSTANLLEEIVNPDLVEDFIAGAGEERDFDFNALYEQLAHYRKHPLSLNKVGREELTELGLLSELQINSFLRYRETCGNFIALQELQAVPSFSLQTIQQLLPFVSLQGDLDDYRVSFGKMLGQGSNQLFLRWTRLLQDQEGFLRGPEDGRAFFRGDPNRYYLRYRHSYDNRLSYGLTAEKDPGEEFFTGSNPQGFDFYSAHLYLNRYNRWLKTLALGDFTASFGQGLILFSGFGSRKGSMVMQIKRNRRTLMPYRSADENNFLRGAGLTLSPTANLDVTLFASTRRRDANIVLPDSLEADLDFLPFEIFGSSSLQNTGLHRTDAEIFDEKQIEQRTLGASVKYHTNRWHLALNGLYEDIDRPLELTDRPFNQFFFSGTRLFNASIDYAFLWRNANFFGETAISDNGGLATTNGLLWGLDRRLDFALKVRHFERNYQALNPNPLAETIGARNETGIYLALVYRLNRRWWLSGYYDLYRHPWLRSNAAAPSNGVDYRLRLTYFRKRQLETYVELRNEIKRINSPVAESNIRRLTPHQRLQLRLHLTQNISKRLTLKSRIDLGFSEKPPEERFRGFVIYQDVIWKVGELPLKLSTRFALFDVEDFDIRFWEYENDLLYTFSIPAYFNRGYRFYLNARYRVFRGFTLEARYAETYWDQDSFGSGINEIQGNRRSEVKVQISYSF